MRSVNDIIQALGGRTAVASAMGCSYGTVRNWDEQGSVPSKRWRDLLAVADAKGVELTLDRLAAICVGRAA